jgi:serine/threonine-protein kinase
MAGVRASGRLQGRFEVLEKIGEGGFASVYRARETTTGRVVALKLLKDAFLKDTEVVERFRREVFAVASITSPYVVKMHDFGISGDEVFIAMEYVEGPTLRRVMHERVWTASDIHIIVGQVAQALAAAHRQNIVHRDLKPENVMLVGGNREGGGPRQVKVLDFGLAKLAELERKLELEPLTRAGMCFGTPQYMSPEQIQGRKIDGAADNYALAVIAYELIAGLLPWDGNDSREILISVIKHPPPRIVRTRSDVKRLDELNKFFTRALAKEKKDRPRDAAEFFKEFEHALFGARRPVPRGQVKQLDEKDQVFASVIAASIELPTLPNDHGDFGDTMVEAAPSEFPIEPTASSGLSGLFSGVRRRSKLKSSWMVSLPGIDLPDEARDDSGPFATQTTTVHHSPSGRRRAPEPEPAPLPSLHFGAQRHDSITAPVTPLVRRLAPTRPSAGVPAWVVMLLLLLVIAAAGMGFWIGRRH